MASLSNSLLVLIAASAPLCHVSCRSLTSPSGREGPLKSVVLEDTGSNELQDSFDGLWETNFGRMRLRRTGTNVTGIYSHSLDSLLEGEILGRRLNFRFADESGEGEGWFDLAESGQDLRGQWRIDGSETWGEWSGSRVAPVPGQRWLVVLEAHWERGLEENEYAFGDMLKTYFKMATARHVRVRHRFFHDRADFVRFARETAYLTEPVTLLVSSHGTEGGIEVDGMVITAADVGAALSHAFNIDLLHLSGCSMMNGPMPAQIRDALDTGPRFPISGYTKVVAWDASAISDFIYLSMILIRELSPEEAVTQTHLVAPYTRPTPVADSAFAAMGLSISTARPTNNPRDRAPGRSD